MNVTHLNLPQDVKLILHLEFIWFSLANRQVVLSTEQEELLFYKDIVWGAGPTRGNESPKGQQRVTQGLSGSPQA